MEDKFSIDLLQTWATSGGPAVANLECKVQIALSLSNIWLTSDLPSGAAHFRQHPLCKLISENEATSARHRCVFEVTQQQAYRSHIQLVLHACISLLTWFPNDARRKRM